MFDKKVLIIIFVAMVLAQWYVPGSMVLNRETTIKKGQEFKFECLPVDPNDPFRGKYITLRFQADTYSFYSDGSQLWSFGQLVFVTVEQDINGFAKISDVNRTKPKGISNYFKANIRGDSYSGDNNQRTLTLEFPFNRFYMEEHKAPLAEQLYGEQLRDSTSLVYASVSILEGNAVLKDVIINGESIQEAVEDM